MASIGTGHRVGGPGGRRDPHRDRLLALAGMGGAVDGALEEHGLDPILEGPYLAHGLVASDPARLEPEPPIE